MKQAKIRIATKIHHHNSNQYNILGLLQPYLYMFSDLSLWTETIIFRHNIHLI